MPGLRREEACSVRIDDVNGAELFVRGTKTKNAERTIQIPKGIADDLHRFAKESKRFLVETESGGQLKNNFSRLTAGAYDQALLERYDLHGLRHAFGAIEIELGCPRAVRMAILGQSTRGVQDLYQHSAPADMREWLGRWHDCLKARREECLQWICGYAVGTDFSGCLINDGELQPFEPKL